MLYRGSPCSIRSNLPPKEASWEDYDYLKVKLPDFNTNHFMVCIKTKVF